MNSTQPCVLIVEDTVEIARMVSDYLKERDYQTLTAANVYQALELIKANEVDVVVLDWMLPGASGLDLLKLLVDQPPPIPKVIVLTARAEERDVVEGLEAGADDYVTKPFSLTELHARIKRLIRGMPKHQEIKPLIRIGRAEIDTRTSQVRIGGEPYPLGEIAYRLLIFLYSHPNEIHSRQNLLRAAWPPKVHVGDRTVDVHIYHLRKFLKKQCEVDALKTIRQQGYRFTLN